MVASDCKSSDMHSCFSKGKRYSMNRTEFAPLVRKISVPGSVIYGVLFWLLAFWYIIYTPDIMPPVMVPFACLSMNPSMISGLLLCSAICLFCVCYLTRHLFGDRLWLIMLFALGFISAEAERNISHRAKMVRGCALQDFCMLGRAFQLEPDPSHLIETP
jgi:hypothetical protein